ncbi:hypothetical protein QJS10_CPB11g00597 [Acorus calamus]|uniref:DUF4378 domain-containing protein n=1 Tax=Acorus calamus TaxID=4465 RepID=A0AAV9DW40_ACOCL|nr:hypothetical protein QJS10_CPB11g00597 [Acorus calamus]
MGAKTVGPLRLKDFLNDDEAFRPPPTVRSLLEMEMNDQDCARPRLDRSKSTAAAMSALHKAVTRLLRFSSSSAAIGPRPAEGILRRSFSRRLRRSFWKGIGRSRSFQGGLDVAEVNKLYSPGEKRSPTTRVGERFTETATGRMHPKEEHEERVMEVQCAYKEEQFSPVSVMDFPFEEEHEEGASDREEEESSSPSSFQQSLDNIERRKLQLLNKIRNFERLTFLDPINLEERIDSSSEFNSYGCDSPLMEENSVGDEEEEEEAMQLLKLLKETTPESFRKKCYLERLFIEFFTEGLIVHDGQDRGSLLLKAATDWLNAGRSIEQESWEAEVKEAVSCGRWSRFKEEEDEFGVSVEVGVWGSLLDELLTDLQSC